MWQKDLQWQWRQLHLFGVIAVAIHTHRRPTNSTDHYSMKGATRRSRIAFFMVVATITTVLLIVLNKKNKNISPFSLPSLISPSTTSESRLLSSTKPTKCRAKGVKQRQQQDSTTMYWCSIGLDSFRKDTNWNDMLWWVYTHTIY